MTATNEITYLYKSMIQLVTTTTLARKYILLIHQQEDQHMVHIHLQEDPHMVHIHLQKGREHYLNAGCCLAWLPPRLVAPLCVVGLQIMRAAVLLHIGALGLAGHSLAASLTCT